MSEDASGMTPREKAEMILKMTKEAKRVERRLGAESCIVICIFSHENKEGGKSLTFQDAGRFPMPPDHFYHVMQEAHKKGMMANKPKILKPH
jgi:hypothetical protein